MLTLLPTEKTHGHHKMATILALEAINELHIDNPPIILSGKSIPGNEIAPDFDYLKDFPITKISLNSPKFEFDRTQSFSYKNKLNYKIIANWAIAEHKSQGTMQLLMNKVDIEIYYYYSLNSDSSVEKTVLFFESLKQPLFQKKYYNTK